MNTIKLISSLFLATLLLSCAPKNTSDKPHGVLSDAQKQTLDKAKKTEELLDKTNKERMKEADEASSDK